MGERDKCQEVGIVETKRKRGRNEHKQGTALQAGGLPVSWAEGRTVNTEVRRAELVVP